MAFENNFVNSQQECLTENCKNDCLKLKDTCKQCTEVNALRSEIKKLHDKLYDLEEHIVNLETNQELSEEKTYKGLDKKTLDNAENVKKKRKTSQTKEECEKLINENLPENIEKRLTAMQDLFRKEIDEKIEREIQRNLNREKPTYASALSSYQEKKIKTTSEVSEHSLSDASNDEILRRNKNVIVYGLKECEDLVTDQKLIRKFLHQINAIAEPRKTYRLGRNTIENKMIRPVKIIFNSEEDADGTLCCYRMNGGSKDLETTFVRKDYSSEERDQIRAMVQEARAKNEREDTGVTWKVRGCPRSNLRIEAIQSETTGPSTTSEKSSIGRS